MSDLQTRKPWQAPAMTTLSVERTLSGQILGFAENCRSGFFNSDGVELIGAALHGPACS